ncbi:hypothetical protein BDF19DRAFT_438727 [Syncephalis fuscata]|nr:hypothetical protein BDF19DRAFT_438727 [Syncephalis fuscata]
MKLRELIMDSSEYTSISTELLWLACNFTFDIAYFLLKISTCSLLVCSFLFQIRKIIQLKSSAGISVWFLFISVIGSWSNAVNVVILQWPTIQCCSKVAMLICIDQAFPIAQLITSALGLVTIFCICVYYFPKDKRYINRIALPLEDENSTEEYQTNDSLLIENTPNNENCQMTPEQIELPKIMIQEWATAQLLTRLVLGWMLFTVMASLIMTMTIDGTTFIYVYRWAQLLGVINLSTIIMQFIPQLWTTWRCKEIGALSMGFLSFQLMVGIPFTYVLIRQDGADWSTWTPSFILTFFQIILFSLCLFYYINNSRPGSIVLPDESTANSSVYLPHLSSTSDSLSIYEDNTYFSGNTARQELFSNQ